MAPRAEFRSRGEKNTNWEGGHRVPTFIRWPRTIEPGTVVNDVGAHEDMLPALVAAACNPNATKQLLDGTTLRMDPFERAQHGNAMGFQRWHLEHMLVIAPADGYVGQWLQSFKELPPRQKPGSFNLDRVMETVTSNDGTD